MIFICWAASCWLTKRLFTVTGCLSAQSMSPLANVFLQRIPLTDQTIPPALGSALTDRKRQKWVAFAISQTQRSSKSCALWHMALDHHRLRLGPFCRASDILTHDFVCIRFHITYRWGAPISVYSWTSADINITFLISRFRLLLWMRIYIYIYIYICSIYRLN